jgi:hypothetical protein
MSNRLVEVGNGSSLLPISVFRIIHWNDRAEAYFQAVASIKVPISSNTNEAPPQTDEVYPYPKSCGFRLM